MKIMKQALALFRQAETPSMQRSYVISQTFSGIGNCFDPDEIWERPRMVIGDHRLRSLLHECRFHVGAREQVFSHVKVELPAMNVEHDRRISRGVHSNCLNLANELAQRHRDAFGKYLGPEEQPRYSVEAALDLVDDQVRICFGHGIYVPEENERMAWRIEASPDGLFTIRDGTMILPEQQHLCVLGTTGKEARHVSLACPGWPFAEHVSLVIVNDPSREKLSITAEPLDALSVSYREAIDSYVVEQPNSIGPSPNAPIYYLRTARLSPVLKQVPNIPAVIRKRQTLPTGADKSAERGDEPALVPASGHQKTGGQPKAELHTKALPIPCEPTLMPMSAKASPVPDTDATWLVSRPPQRPARLYLSGIAMQRPSLFQTYGISALSIGFDASGQIVPPQSDRWHLRIIVNTNDEVRVETRQGDRSLTPGEILPLPGQQTIDFVAAPVSHQDHYLGMLRIPEKLSQDIPAGADLLVSRDAARSTFSRLQVLNSSGFISAAQNPGGDCMGISSQHCSIRLDDDTLTLNQQGRLPLTILNEDQQTATLTTIQTPVEIRDGQFLMLGHYLWRFACSKKTSKPVETPC